MSRKHRLTRMMSPALIVGIAALDLVIGVRLGYAFSTAHFFTALVQYNSDTRDVSGDLRLNLFHTPAGDFYLVYNERRSSTGKALDRAIICKLTHIVSF